ncbi:MAG: polyamine aminopropyltransferase [Bacteroidota bacterium]
MPFLLLFSVFVIATCGLIYELVAGTLASYLLGDSVTQFSTIIGTYLFAMGIGSFLSKYVQKNLITVFIRVELLIGLLGGFSAAFLFLVFEFVSAFKLLMYGQVALTGILVGLEIPLLMRIMKDRFEFKDLVGNIFTFDYIGALAASILFPVLLVPHLGLVRTSLLFGIFNVAVAMWAIYLFRDQVKGIGLTRTAAGLSMVALILGMVFSGNLLRFAEAQGYAETIIYAKSSQYQRIVLTRGRKSFRLFLNGNLQFDARDEYRYHEALIHPGLAALPQAKKALVMGGGDGLAVREILKYPGIESVDLVDLDPAVTQLFRDRDDLAALNRGALSSPKVTVTNDDAFGWVRRREKPFDFIAVDFPDPSNFSLGKLYSLRFYQELFRITAPYGIIVIQSTSPYVAPNSFWCVERTLSEAGFETVPYHAYVPSFGEWGFIIGLKRPYEIPQTYPDSLRFVTPGTVKEMLNFPPDMQKRSVEVNRLNNQVLVQYFEAEWGNYVE